MRKRQARSVFPSTAGLAIRTGPAARQRHVSCQSAAPPTSSSQRFYWLIWSRPRMSGCDRLCLDRMPGTGSSDKFHKLPSEVNSGSLASVSAARAGPSRHWQSDGRCIERQTVGRYPKPPCLSITIVSIGRIAARRPATGLFFYCDFWRSRRRHGWGADAGVILSPVQANLRAGSAVIGSELPAREFGQRALKPSRSL